MSARDFWRSPPCQARGTGVQWRCRDQLRVLSGQRFCAWLPSPRTGATWKHCLHSGAILMRTRPLRRPLNLPMTLRGLAGPFLAVVLVLGFTGAEQHADRGEARQERVTPLAVTRVPSPGAGRLVPRSSVWFMRSTCPGPTTCCCCAQDPGTAPSGLPSASSSATGTTGTPASTAPSTRRLTGSATPLCIWTTATC